MRRSTAFTLALLLLAAASCDSRSAAVLKGRAVVDGRPAPGATVSIYDVPEKSAAPPVKTALTGRDGTFSAELSPGTYYVAVRLNPAGGGPALLSKMPPDPVVVGPGASDAGDMSLSQVSGEAAARGMGVRGRVVDDGRPVAGALVYLYDGTDSGLKGPSYKASTRTDRDGSFQADVRPGRYYVAVRKRRDESSAGELSPGDLSGECRANPVAVRASGYADTGAIEVGEIDPAKLDGLMIGIKEAKGAASISGHVTGEDGRPLSGVYVFAYEDYRMMGKPRLISERTGADGAYRLFVDRPGTYYMGARNTLGGPMEPGDLVGVYGGSKDNSVSVTKGGSITKADIALKEVQ